MAAKQGITAHITQASEDARRAVIRRAPASVQSHSWLSNLNTTCTIKSAPPRTPEVMMLLASKSGWLTKRNEQHVWQRRYCCVVPHTMLYYFEAEPCHMGGYPGEHNGMEAVYGGEDGGDTVTGGGEQTGSGEGGGTSGISSSAGPVGIIDLECYTTVERNAQDPTIMELTGDAITNPDLRSFFFQGENESDCETWTKALLSDRHQALRDEREAYKQVCDSFPLQLSHCSRLIDEAEAETKRKEKEIYDVRSAIEEGRKQVLNQVRDGVESLASTSPQLAHNHSNDDAYSVVSGSGDADLIGHLNHILSDHHVGMLGGVFESIELLIHHARDVSTQNTDYRTTLSRLKREHETLRNASSSDLQQNKKALDIAQQKQSLAQKRSAERITSLENALANVRAENANLRRGLEAKTMEFGMVQSQTKNKLTELSKHKKILKTEVIELRKKLEDATSESDATRHQMESLRTRYEAEQSKHKQMRESYEGLRHQLDVQDRMMDQMSDVMSIRNDERSVGSRSVGSRRSTRSSRSARSRRSKAPTPIAGRQIRVNLMPPGGGAATLPPAHKKSSSNSNNTNRTNITEGNDPRSSRNLHDGEKLSKSKHKSRRGSSHHDSHGRGSHHRLDDDEMSSASMSTYDKDDSNHARHSRKEQTSNSPPHAHTRHSHNNNLTRNVERHNRQTEDDEDTLDIMDRTDAMSEITHDVFDSLPYSPAYNRPSFSKNSNSHSISGSHSINSQSQNNHKFNYPRDEDPDAQEGGNNNNPNNNGPEMVGLSVDTSSTQETSNVNVRPRSFAEYKQNALSTSKHSSQAGSGSQANSSHSQTKTPSIPPSSHKSASDSSMAKAATALVGALTLTKSHTQQHTSVASSSVSISTRKTADETVTTGASTAVSASQATNPPDIDRPKPKQAVSPLQAAINMTEEEEGDNHSESSDHKEELRDSHSSFPDISQTRSFKIQQHKHRYNSDFRGGVSPRLGALGSLPASPSTPYGNLQSPPRRGDSSIGSMSTHTPSISLTHNHNRWHEDDASSACGNSECGASSVVTTDTARLSVAQRARMEAESGRRREMRITQISLDGGDKGSIGVMATSNNKVGVMVTSPTAGGAPNSDDEDGGGSMVNVAIPRKFAKTPSVTLEEEDTPPPTSRPLLRAGNFLNRWGEKLVKNIDNSALGVKVNGSTSGVAAAATTAASTTTSTTPPIPPTSSIQTATHTTPPRYDRPPQQFEAPKSPRRLPPQSQQYEPPKSPRRFPPPPIQTGMIDLDDESTSSAGTGSSGQLSHELHRTNSNSVTHNSHSHHNDHHDTHDDDSIFSNSTGNSSDSKDLNNSAHTNISVLTEDFSSTLGRDAQVQRKAGPMPTGGFRGLAASVGGGASVSSGMFGGGGSVKSSQSNIVHSDVDLKWKKRQEELAKTTRMSAMQIRQQLQREKQLEFLNNRGLLQK